MRTISALQVRAKFGQVLDEAAAGERFIVERAGMPVAAIVPLRDLEAVDPERVRERRLAAVDELARIGRMGAADSRSRPTREEIVAWIREGREERPR
jgi:prevent-host-death family protein